MLREKCPLHTFGELDFRVFCRCGYSLRDRRTHHTPILSRPLRHLRVSTGSRQRWGRRLGAPSQDPQGRAPRDGTLFLPGLYPWKPASRWTRWPPRRAYRNPRVLKKAGGDIAPGRAGGFGFQAPPVSSAPRPFSSRGPSAFPRGLCGREGKGEKERLFPSN